MAGWSSLAVRSIGRTNLVRSVLASRNELTLKCLNCVSVRNSGHGNQLPIRPSQYRFLKLKDIAHFYLLLGALPFGALILYCHIFIGPAKLAEIPEGYVPKHWEYYQHPISRWMAKLLPSPQECYEKEMHKIYRITTRQEISKVEKKIIEFMKDRDDYQAWYFIQSPAKYTRKAHEMAEEFEEQRGKTVGLVI